MGRLTVLFAVIYLLAGCATKEPVKQPQAPIVVGTQVDVAVREKCSVSLPMEPVWALDALPPDATMFTKARAVIAEIQQRRKYEADLRIAAAKCE